MDSEYDNEYTLVSCVYNTPDLILNLLRSYTQITDHKRVLIINTSTEPETEEVLKVNEIPYVNLPGSCHGDAVNEALNLVETPHMLLVDSDIIFLKNFDAVLDNTMGDVTIFGDYCYGNRGGKRLYPRINPWFCLMDVESLNRHNIPFYDKERSLKSKEEGGIVYDIGSTMCEDVDNTPELFVGIPPVKTPLENRYFKHYEGMSWRVQKFNPNDEDTDIDQGGTHPNKALYDYGLQVRAEYIKETKYLKDVEIKGVFI